MRGASRRGSRDASRTASRASRDFTSAPRSTWRSRKTSSAQRASATGNARRGPICRRAARRDRTWRPFVERPRRDRNAGEPRLERGADRRPTTVDAKRDDVPGEPRVLNGIPATMRTETPRGRHRPSRSGRCCGRRGVVVFEQRAVDWLDGDLFERLQAIFRQSGAAHRAQASPERRGLRRRRRTRARSSARRDRSLATPTHARGERDPRARRARRAARSLSEGRHARVLGAYVDNCKGRVGSHASRRRASACGHGPTAEIGAPVLPTGRCLPLQAKRATPTAEEVDGALRGAPPAHHREERAPEALGSRGRFQACSPPSPSFYRSRLWRRRRPRQRRK